MIATHRLVANLLDAVDSTEGEYIRIPKTDAVRIAELLVNAQFVSEAPSYRDGEILFFCPKCEKSFAAEGREDKECFEKWHYHTWHADCPWCGREISQNDGYWR